MKNLLLIGDSIRMGYDKSVKKTKLGGIGMKRNYSVFIVIEK